MGVFGCVKQQGAGFQCFHDEHEEGSKKGRRREAYGGHEWPPTERSRWCVRLLIMRDNDSISRPGIDGYSATGDMVYQILIFKGVVDGYIELIRKQQVVYGKDNPCEVVMC